MIFKTTYNDNNYPIILKQNALTDIKHYLKENEQNIVLIDQDVYRFHKEYLKEQLEDDDIKFLTIMSGEVCKQMSYFESISEKLLSMNITRQSQLIAIGGGATGDFVGFLAATLLRGIDFIQVPTTLLAHDSAIGGKVGINASVGKNLIGAFHRPHAVIYDTKFLETLPHTEIRSGYGEIYKHAILNSEADTTRLMEVYPSIKELSQLENIETFLKMGIETKLKIVIEDEFEGGVRKHLNLGHTFGHGIEYLTKIAHGEAVMIGILFQKVINKNRNLYDTLDTIDALINYLKELGYPLNILNDADIELIFEYMKKDKKNIGQSIQMVLQKGEASFTIESVSKDEVLDAFNELKALINE
ncbi:3-dehydroquinate synthase [Mammaliicoccus vitulinus]|uniref:3-dehydroquinate synthase n=1 Tax=Mammaliicoccus vitulinus TaxID=71237 RepID=UPI0002F1CFB7|nr:3-dehydroquinate synthase [Mammaliicoccus vitulinus]